MSKHLTAEELALYTDAMRLERTTELPARLERHVSSCEKCKREILILVELGEELRHGTNEPHPYFDRAPLGPRSPWQTVWRVAAVLAVAAGLGVIWYTLDPPGARAPEPLVEYLQVDSAAREESPILQEAAKATPLPPSEDLAARFAESPNLEDLVGMPLRSGVLAASTPPPSAVLDGSVELAWQTSVRGPYRVSILDNRDRVVFDSSIAVSRVAIPGELAPGLYYWKVVADGKLQFVSKFFVKERPWGERSEN